MKISVEALEIIFQDLGINIIKTGGGCKENTIGRFAFENLYNYLTGNLNIEFYETRAKLKKAESK